MGNRVLSFLAVDGSEWVERSRATRLAGGTAAAARSFPLTVHLPSYRETPASWAEWCSERYPVSLPWWVTL